MIRRSWLLICAFLVCWQYAPAARIVLVYPRDIGTEPHVYANNVDSTFILGRVEPPTGTLSANGNPVPYDDQGAFLAWLPLRKTPGMQSWHLRLMAGTQELASLDYRYALESDTAKPKPSVTTSEIHFPRVVCVTVPNAHMRTAFEGTYHVFPDVGCTFIALGMEGDFYRVRLGGAMCDYIENSVAELEPDTILPDVLLGNGSCTQINGESVCSFAAARPVAWTSEPSSDFRTLRVMLFGVRAAMNRIRYDVGDSFLHDISWEQQSDGLRLDVHCTGDIVRGFEISFARDSLVIRLRAPYAKGKRTLHGKTIVLDPGHGGESTGTIGPLGTEEKDVVLRWARILGAQLRREGANVKYTRTADTNIPLYNRVDFGRRERADFFLSLHCNALPDTENPFLRHGGGTYFYQRESRDAAGLIHKRLLAAAKLRDDGLYDANLAVVRPTDFPAVLIEAAYLIYPPEEKLLRSDDFLRSLSEGVVRGLNDYFQRVP
jgi:N-acetylmuramoyl-L-alanine amidase